MADEKMNSPSSPVDSDGVRVQGRSAGRERPKKDAQSDASQKKRKSSGKRAAQGAGRGASKITKNKKSRGAARRKMSRAERRAQRKSRIRRFIATFAVLAVCLLLALVVGDNDYMATPVGWVPFIACAAAVLGAFLYLQVLKRGLRMMEKTNFGSCERGRDVKFTVRFRNTTPLFFFRIEAYFFVADLYGATVSRAMTTLALAPFEKYDMDFTTRFDHIGTYRAGLERVVISDYLRLFSATLEGPKQSAVQVTPRIVPIERITFSNESMLETTKAMRSVFSDSLDYAGVRDYVPGDPLKTIHWKLSARGENYLTRVFEMYTEPGVAVVMDFYGPGKTSPQLMTMFDCVVETALSVARYAQEQGMESEIFYCNRYGEKVRRTSWRKDELAQMISEMPRFSNDGARAVDALGLLNDQIASQYGQNNLAVCTANISSEMVSTIIQAKLRHRQPMLFAIAPHGLEGRDRDRWAAPLARLDEAGIGYVILSDSKELEGVVS